MTTLSRRSFLAGAVGAAAAAAVRPTQGWAAAAPAARRAAVPAAAPFDHVVVVMMENRSFDHFLGWLPGADGRQEGLTFANSAGTVYPTYNLAPDFQGCGYGDPDHSWQGGLVQLNGGKADGWLRTPANRRADDTFPIGFYNEAPVPVLGALARNYTTLDRYFAAILAETYPNRIYAHAATTDRDVNTLAISSLPTIWDRVAGAGLQGRYYFNDLPILALWGAKYAPIMRPFAEFLADAATGLLPQVSFVDPSFNGADVGTPSKVPPSAGDIIGSGEGDGTSADDHPTATSEPVSRSSPRCTRRCARARRGRGPSSSSTTTSGAVSTTTSCRPRWWTPRRVPRTRGHTPTTASWAFECRAS